MNEQELKDQCTAEFIKWMCELAEGYEFVSDDYEPETYGVLNICDDYYDIENVLKDMEDFPLLIHRAVEGWNKITRNKYIIITDTFLYTTSNLHRSDERYNYNNYQPQSLTQAECATLNCLIDIFKEEIK